MKLLCLSVLLLLITASSQVTHAPTADQCKADQRVWLSKLKDAPSEASYLELNGWMGEMGTCMQVDPSRQPAYFTTASGAMTEQRGRLINYLERHGEWRQFLEEDTQGKR